MWRVLAIVNTPTYTQADYRTIVIPEAKNHLICRLNETRHSIFTLQAMGRGVPDSKERALYNAALRFRYRDDPEFRAKQIARVRMRRQQRQTIPSTSREYYKQRYQGRKEDVCRRKRVKYHNNPEYRAQRTEYSRKYYARKQREQKRKTGETNQTRDTQVSPEPKVDSKASRRYKHAKPMDEMEEICVSQDYVWESGSKSRTTSTPCWPDDIATIRSTTSSHITPSYNDDSAWTQSMKDGVAPVFESGFGDYIWQAGKWCLRSLP